MPNRSRYRSRTFGVLEIILSVGILTVFAVPVLQLFVKASQEEKRTRMTDTAVAAAVSYVEEFRSGSTPFALSRTLGGSPEPDGSGYRGQADLGDGVTATVTIRRDSENAGGSLYAIAVSVSGKGIPDSLYTLNGLRYFPK